MKNLPMVKRKIFCDLKKNPKNSVIKFVDDFRNQKYIPNFLQSFFESYTMTYFESKNVINFMERLQIRDCLLLHG